MAVSAKTPGYEGGEQIRGESGPVRRLIRATRYY